jgi:glycosyltransferase involved in cell wall biosynthesis
VGLRPRPAGPWVAAQDQPASPNVLADFRLFAIIGTWMEEDVIAATVANAFVQGCERVYLVDNDSADGTVREAVAAGAELAQVFSTDRYDEVLRLKIMNQIVQTVSEASGSDYVWWLWLDADEFPHGPRGTTIREYLEPLDRRFRVVGARFINHFPDREPAYVTGFHPLDFQPLCEEHLLGCALKHRKHPLQRFDRRGAQIICDRGFHRATSAERPLIEPTEAIYLHHFPYRDPHVTRRRLAMLCGTDETGRTRVQEGDDAADGMVPRFETLDAVYRGDWEHVRNYRFDGEFSVARPVPWTQLAGPEDLPVRRWYTTEGAEGRP